MTNCFVVVELWQSKTDAPVFKRVHVFAREADAIRFADQFNTKHLDSKYWAEVHPTELSE